MLKLIFVGTTYSEIYCSFWPTCRWQNDGRHGAGEADRLKACSIFRAQSADIYFVELYADVDTRLERNTSPLRLEHKASKRDVEHSKQNILNWHKKYKLNSDDDFFYTDNYVNIDNSDKSAKDVAAEIVAKLGL